MRWQRLVCALGVAVFSLSLAFAQATGDASHKQANTGAVRVASAEQGLPTLLSGSYEAVDSSGTNEKKGGCVSGILGCCLATPFGQWENSGYKPDAGRAIARVLVVGMLYDGYKAYQGETTEEYLKVSSLSDKTPPAKKGGVVAGLESCCLTGVPAGQLRNSGTDVPGRAWLRLVPYVNVVVQAYDGVKAYQGETIEDYLGTTPKSDSGNE